MTPAAALSDIPPPALPVPVWKETPLHWLLLVLGLAAAIAAFLPGVTFMVSRWEALEEYSYGYLIPAVSAFLIWQKSQTLRTLPLAGSWTGMVLVTVAIALGIVGQLSAIRLFSQYGFLVALLGLSVCFLGWRGTRVIGAPLAILFFMVPLPQFVLRELSQQLQLVSSEIGVAMIRAFGISVFLEGNVIDLGGYKLQIVEACSGLRYLFPLLVLGSLAAYFFQGAWWKRVLIVVSTVPLTILINSLRIAIIGWTVEHWGSAMAEGLLHDFEGWFMFMICVALLVAEMAVLARTGSRPASLRAVFGLDFPEPVAAGTPRRARTLPSPMVVGVLVLAVVGALTWWKPSREPVHPARTPFALFPMTLPGGWSGRLDRLDSDVVAALAVDDYLLADYARPGQPPVNLYSAYYDSQSGGASTHSPRTCIPGDGWKIVELAETPVRFSAEQGGAGSTRVLEVNRAVIQKGEQRQLVYYWFSQRGRSLTDEFAVKWYILHDAVTLDRSDGALVRLVTPVVRGEAVADADRRLAGFLGSFQPQLARHVPG